MIGTRFILLATLLATSGCALSLDKEELREKCGAECQNSSCGAGEYLDIEKKCQALSRCEDDEFESEPPSATSDRTCQEVSTCQPGTFVVTGPTPDQDRVCAACPKDTFSDQENALSCAPVRECGVGEGVVSVAEPAQDLLCAPCGPDEFERSGHCLPVTECGPDEFEFSSPNATTDRACRPITDCEPGTEIEFTHTKTRDRFCSPCEANTFSSTKNAVECTPWTNCNSDPLAGDLEIESVAPTKESDRECVLSYCGDGIVDLRLEEDCDDANDDEFDSCTSECKTLLSSEGKPCTTDDDCNDSECIAFYFDADHDGFAGTRAFSDFCENGPPDNYSPIKSDCCDEDTSARPSQSDYFAEPSACGNFDYNCDGDESRGFVALSECLTVDDNALSFRGWLDEIPECGAEGEYAEAQKFELVCEPETELKTQVCR